ncbi:AbfB domain-containing protein [Streptomyces scabiei]|uniref:AbfB domain-containing protein n=2 Tax=Streptomyces scabiei TaxID=1930 RepID=UPI002FF00473
MPPTKPGPDPDQTPPSLPMLRSAKVWETGVAPNDTRIPGTRRLWLAGALALAVVSSCVTAITLQGSGPDDSSEKNGRTTAADDRVPTVSLPPTSPAATSAPDGKSGLSEPQGADGDGKKDADGKDKKGGSKDKDKGKEDKEPDTSESQQGGAKSPKPTKKPSATTRLKSVQSASFRDRYWHLRDGMIQLDQVSSSSDRWTRQDSSFTVVSGLAKSSCYSFRLKDGRYARHQNFVLRASQDDGSQLFKQDATFCPRNEQTDVVGLESVNYPNHFIRVRYNQLRLERYEHNQQYWMETGFRLVKGLA